MVFPAKFERLANTSEQDVDIPDAAWITYSACITDADACGWKGWILESVTQADRQLPIDTRHTCPTCNRPLFRTSVSFRWERAADQTPPLVEGADYETKPMKFGKQPS